MIPDLTDRVAGTRSHVLVQASAGSGKSHLLREVSAATGAQPCTTLLLHEPTSNTALREHTRAAYLRIGQPTLADTVDEPRSLSPGLGHGPLVTLVIDGVGHLDPSASDWLLAHLRRRSSGLRLVAAARALPESVRALEFEAITEWVTDEHLEASPREVADLLAKQFGHQELPGFAAELLRSGVGSNFALLHATLQRATLAPVPADELVRLVHSGEVYRTMVGSAMARLSEQERWALGQVAHLPVLTDATVHTLGGAETVARWLDVGLPISLRPNGNIVLPAPLRAELCRTNPFSRETARLVAPLYVASGETGAAIDALLLAGDDDAVVRLLGSLDRNAAGGLGPARLLGLIERLGPLVDRQPSVRLLQAAALRQLGRVTDQERVLDEALHLTSLDPPLRRLIEAELVAARLTSGPTAELLGRLDDIEQRTPTSEVATRARLITARANALAWTNDGRSQAEADLLFRQAAAMWAALDDRLAQAHTLIGWAMYVLVPGIRYDSATRALREASELSRRDPFLRAQSLVFLAQTAAQLNDAAVARPAIDEARALGQAAGLAWVDAYACLADIYLAAFVDDSSAIRLHASSALDRLGQLDGLATKEIVLAETARALAQAGDPVGAAEYLARVPAHGQAPEARALANLTLESLHGDPMNAIAVADDIVAQRLLAPSERWRIEVHRALALARCGQGDQSRAATARANRLASDWGVGQLPDQMEPRARSLTRTLLDDTNDAEAGSSPRSVELKVFGAFAIRRGARTIQTPPRVPATIIKLVAVNGGSVSIDIVLAALWPDAPSEVGRRRLRNAISRAREAIGDVIERINDAIAFSEDVTVDACVFDENYRAVQRLLPHDSKQAATVARAALISFDTLLVDDLYEDWAADARAALRQRAAALIDVVVAAGVDTATGAWLADLAIGIDPFDDGRLVRLAGVLTEIGAQTLATALLDRAAAIAADLAGGRT